MRGQVKLHFKLCIAAAVVWLPSIASAHSLVIRSVGPDGNPFFNGIRCGKASAVTGDILPDWPNTDSNGTVVLRISEVIDKRRNVVGWIFYGSHGNLIELGTAMSSTDAKMLGADPSHKLQLVGFSKPLPGDLHSKRCADSLKAPDTGYIDRYKR